LTFPGSYQLLCRDVLLFTLDARFLGFEHIKELYKDDSDFANVYKACETSAFGKFYRLDGYLFKESHLCVPLSSIYMNCLFANQYSLGGGFCF